MARSKTTSKSKSKSAGKKAAKVPKKYTAGLKKGTASKRASEIRKRAKASRSGKPNYSALPGDKSAKTKPSSYTRKAQKSGLKGRISRSMKSNTKEGYLRAVAKETGYPLGILRQVHERGARAWATGRRPGASQVAWSRGRVLSFVQGGKTTRTADEGLYKRAKRIMSKRKSKSS